jgi:hypothetical protein
MDECVKIPSVEKQWKMFCDNELPIYAMKAWSEWFSRAKHGCAEWSRQNGIWADKANFINEDMFSEASQHE